MADTALDVLTTIFRFITDTKPIKNATAVLTGFQARVDDINKRLTSSKEKTNALGKSVGGMFLSMYAGRRAIQAVTGMKDKINEFELAMNLVESKTRASRQEMDRMRLQAMQLGVTTVFTASQAAEAQAKLAQAGFDAQQIFGIVPSVLNLASAGQLSLAKSAEITANVLRGYNLSAERAAQVTDLMAAAAANSNTTVQQLAPMFRYALAPAAFTRTALPDILAINAALRNSSLVAGQAGRGLKEMMNDLAAPTAAAKKVMERLGVDQQRVAYMIEHGGIIQAMEEFHKIRERIGVAEAKGLVGTRHMAAFLIWLDKAPKIAKTARTWSEMMGEAAEQADIMMEGLPGSIKRFESAVEGLVLTFGERKMKSYFVDFFEYLRKQVVSLVGAGPVLQDLTANLLVLGPVLLWIGGIISIIQFTFARGFLGYIIAGFGLLTVSLVTFAQNAGASKGAIIGLVSSLFGLAGVIYLMYIRKAMITAVSLAFTKLGIVLLGFKVGGIVGGFTEISKSMGKAATVAKAGGLAAGLKSFFSIGIKSSAVWLVLISGLVVLLGQLIFNFEKITTKNPLSGLIASLIALAGVFSIIHYKSIVITKLLLGFKSLGYAAGILSIALKYVRVGLLALFIPFRRLSLILTTFKVSGFLAGMKAINASLLLTTGTMKKMNVVAGLKTALGAVFKSANVWMILITGLILLLGQLIFNFEGVRKAVQILFVHIESMLTKIVLSFKRSFSEIFQYFDRLARKEWPTVKIEQYNKLLSEGFDPTTAHHIASRSFERAMQTSQTQFSVNPQLIENVDPMTLTKDIQKEMRHLISGRYGRSIPKPRDFMHAFKSVFYGLTSRRNIEDLVLKRNPVWIKQFQQLQEISGRHSMLYNPEILGFMDKLDSGTIEVRYKGQDIALDRQATLKIIDHIITGKTKEEAINLVVPKYTEQLRPALDTSTKEIVERMYASPQELTTIVTQENEQYFKDREANRERIRAMDTNVRAANRILESPVEVNQYVKSPNKPNIPQIPQTQNYDEFITELRDFAAQSKEKYDPLIPGSQQIEFPGSYMFKPPESPKPPEAFKPSVPEKINNQEKMWTDLVDYMSSLNQITPSFKSESLSLPEFAEIRKPETQLPGIERYYYTEPKSKDLPEIKLGAFSLPGWEKPISSVLKSSTNMPDYGFPDMAAKSQSVQYGKDYGKQREFTMSDLQRETNIRNKYQLLEEQKRSIQNKLSETSINELDRHTLQNDINNINFQQRILDFQKQSSVMSDVQRESLIRDKYINIEMRKRQIHDELRKHELSKKSVNFEGRVKSVDRLESENKLRSENRLSSVERREHQAELQNLYTEQRDLDYQRSMIEDVSRKEIEANKYKQKESLIAKYEQKETNVQNKYTQLEIQKQQIQSKLNQANLSEVDRQVYQRNLENIETQQRVLDSQGRQRVTGKRQKETNVQNKYTQLEIQKQQIQNKLNETNLSEVDRQVYQRNLENLETQQQILDSQGRQRHQQLDLTKLLPQNTYASEFVSSTPSFLGAPIAPQVADAYKQKTEQYNSNINRAASFNITNEISIDARGSNSEEIAQKITTQLEDKMKKAVGNSFKELAHNTDGAEGI